MKFAFITYSPGAVTLQGKWLSKSNCIEAWCHALNADHFTGSFVVSATFEILDQYDVIMVNQNSVLWDLTVEIKANCPGIFLIGVADGSVCDFAKINNVALGQMVLAMEACDLYGSLVDWAEPVYQLITNTPVRWIGIPFYPEFFENYRVELKDKDQQRTVIGLQNSLGQTRNGVISLLVATSVRGSKMLLPYSEGGWEELIQRLNLQGIDAAGYMGWDQYMKRYSVAHFCIHLDTLYTYGRFPLDMAAMGIPVIGTDRNQTNKILWPALTIDPVKDVVKGKKLAEQLVNDIDFYNAQREIGAAGLHAFSAEKVKNRLMNIINEIGV